MSTYYYNNNQINNVWLGNTQINTGTTVFAIPTGSYARYDASNGASYPGAGTTWYDLSGNGNNLTLTGTGVTYSSANGGIFNWNGGGTFTDAAGSTFVSGSQVSMMVWYRDSVSASPFNVGHILLQLGDTAIELDTRSDSGRTVFGPYGAVIYNGIGIIEFNEVDRAADLYLNKWHFLAIVSSPTSTKMFFDNEVFYSPFSGSSLNVVASPSITILPFSDFSGSVGEAAIYNRTLSDNEVYNYYSATSYRYQV